MRLNHRKSLLGSHAAGNLIPIVEIGLSLYDFLCLVGQRGEEVEPGDALYLVNGVDVVALRPVATGVAIDKADALRRTFEAKHYLKESLGHGDLMLTADALMLTAVENGAADDIYFAILLGPSTALVLHLIPVADVEAMVLRTDIGQQKALQYLAGSIDR